MSSLNTISSKSPANPARRAIVIGGSIAGLCCGLALLKREWDVHIFEATEGELAQRGAGIITHQALFGVLEQLGVRGAHGIGVPIQSRRAFTKSGDISVELQLPQFATSWGCMYQLLRRHFPDDRYHQNKTLTRCTQRDKTVNAVFNDDSIATADVLVAADGIRSTVRNQFEPAARPQYTGYIAWRGLIEERDMSVDERREIFPYFTFCLPDGEQVLTYPIAGKEQQIDTGRRRCNVVWYRSASDDTLQELLTDIDGNNNGHSIAPDKVRLDVVERMRRDATALLSPQHTALVQRLAEPFIQPIYDLTTTSMVHGRVVIIGDAAFTARPHLAAGITKATEDALTLATLLDETSDISDALRRFEKKRMGAGIGFVQRSRELGAYLQAQQLSAEERRYASIHRTTNAVLRETAVI